MPARGAAPPDSRKNARTHEARYRTDPAGFAASVAAIPAWERGFYESAFTHANVGRLTRHEGGFEGLWESLKGKRRRFPAESLIQLPQTLDQFVRGEQGNHAH